MGSPVIFNGSYAKVLAALGIKLKDDTLILSGSEDPVVTNPTAPQGSIYLSTLGIYQKNASVWSNLATVSQVQGLVNTVTTSVIYVAKNGLDTNTGGILNPLLTISAAITAATAGTTIYVSPGTYTENLTLKAGVSIIGQQSGSSIITGNITANYSGTVYLHSLDFQASSGIVLLLSGTNATNLQIDDCHIDSLSGASHAISYTNTNAASKLLMDNGAVTVAVSTTAKCFQSVPGVAGSIIFEDISTRILDTKTNNALNIAGALTFSHLFDDVHGTVTVANTASYNGIDLTFDTGSSPMLTTNSSTISTLINIACLSTANPVVTGAGLFAFGQIAFTSTGEGFASTLNGGAGASPIPGSSIQLHPEANTTLPFDGQVNYNGTHLYATIGSTRYQLDQQATGTNTGDQTAITVPNTPSGNLAATNVQTALNELQSDIDTRALTTSGSIITPTRLDMKQDTLANLQTYASTAANGQLVFATDTKATYVVKESALSAVGGGSGSGINYILSPDADSGITGWATYLDAAGTSPVDGTGGSSTITLTRSTVSPLRGTASFLLTKGGSTSRQGNGFSYDFSIDASDKGKVLQASFEYQIASGTYADNDLVVYIYDVTNARLIQPAPYQIKNSGIIEKQALEFQTSIDSTSYRLIIHVSSTSAVDYTVKFDNFNVGPQAKLYGSAVTDFVAFTPTGSWITNTTYSGMWKRVGDQMEANITVATSGAPTNTALTVNLPTGLTIDSSKINTSLVRTPYGQATAWDGGSNYLFQVTPSSNNTSVQILSNTSSGAFVTANNLTSTAPFTWGAGCTITLTIKVPIVGWSSSQVMSSDADTRVVSGSFQTSTTFTPPTSSAVYPTAGWSTLTDTHGKFNSGTYTIPVSGLYKINSFVSRTGTNSNYFLFSYSVNGGGATFFGNAGQTNAMDRYSSNTGVLSFNAGDTVKVGLYSNLGTDTVTYLRWSIERLSGPAQIAASESVSAIYSDSSGQVYPASTTYNAVTFNTKEKDSHNAFNGATGVFTAPMSGQYSVTMSVSASNSLAAAGAYQDISLSTNGLSASITNRQNNIAASQLVTQMVTKTFSLLAGQTVTTVKGATYSVGTYAMFTSGAWNSISITRTGNY